MQVHPLHPLATPMKQRLFDAANRLIPFEKLGPTRRDYIRLSWLVDSDVANAATKNGYIIQMADITCTEKALALCADERAKIRRNTPIYCTRCLVRPEVKGRQL